MAVVKSNAYGHGLADFSKEVSTLGVDWLGVDSAVEALALRRAGIAKPILILSYTLPEMIKIVVDNNVSITVSSFTQLRELLKVKTDKPKSVHIKVDSGMGRQGFLISDQKSLISKLLSSHKLQAASCKLEVEGLYTHFAAAKNPAFPEFTKIQLECFEKWIKAFQRAGFKPIVHAAATGGALLYPESHFDMVRIGIGLYGLWPSKETEAFAKSKIKLMPALSWKTIVSEVKKLPKGSKVGYDGTEILDKESTIAICPIGYWHGYPRALSAVGRALVKGKEVRILGRVSMDMIIADVTGIPNVKIKDVVTIIGRDGKSAISVDDIAAVIDMSPYELVTRINPLIKRIYK
jgi:alanine racemase